MTLREMMRRVAGDDYKLVGVDTADAAQMAALMADEEVWYFVVATHTAGGAPHGIIRLVPEMLPQCPACGGNWNRARALSNGQLCDFDFHRSVPT